MITDITRAEAYAVIAHAGQTDKLGVPYIEHVRAVAQGVSPFGVEYAMTGLFHDLLEDTDLTESDLRDEMVPESVIASVVVLSNTRDVSYEERLEMITKDPMALLVKIADNAHNSRPDRLSRLPAKTGARLSLKYRKAREVLWEAAPSPHIEKILERVNATLLPELRVRGGM